MVSFPKQLEQRLVWNVWVGVTLELSGCGNVDGTMLGNFMFSAIWWDVYKPLDVATGSGRDCVVSKVRTGVTTGGWMAYLYPRKWDHVSILKSDNPSKIFCI